MSGFRSYSKEEIEKAITEGKDVWALDTGSFGADDHLIGSREEVESDVLSHHDLKSLPDEWTLDRA